MSATDTDIDSQYRTALELFDEPDDDTMYLEEGDYVRVYDVHSKAPLMYPEARLARIACIKHGHVVVDLLDWHCFNVASVARPISELEGVIPREWT